MSEIGIDVLIIALLILANGVFAMSEMAVVTARKSRLQDWASKGNTRAKTALELANTPSHFLLAVQIGITLVVILAGALGGERLRTMVAVYIAFFPVFKPYSQAIALALVVLSITLLFARHRPIGSQASCGALSRDSRDRCCHPPPLVLEDIVPDDSPPEYFR